MGKDIAVQFGTFGKPNPEISCQDFYCICCDQGLQPIETQFKDISLGAGWSSPVARQAHNLKVVGSNPTPATNAPVIPRNFV